MIIQLSRHELHLLRDGITMFVFVRWSRGTKPTLTEQDRTTLDSLDKRIFDLVRHTSDDAPTHVGIEVCNRELDIMIMVIETDMRQCGSGESEGSLVEYRVNFGAEYATLEALLAKLRDYRSSTA
jgi:hypothetical protein